MVGELSEPLVLVVVGSAVLVLAFDDWRPMVGVWALTAAASGALMQILAGVPMELAGLQMLSGGLLAVVFYLVAWRAQRTAPSVLSARSIVPWRFRALAGFFLYLLARLLAARFPLPFLPIPLLAMTYALIGIGLLMATLSRSPLKAGLGVLTMFSGYQVFYLAVQDSLIAIGLMAAMSLVVAFLMAAMTLIHQERLP